MPPAADRLLRATERHILGSPPTQDAVLGRHLCGRGTRCGRRLVGTLRSRVPALQVLLLASERSGQLARETLERLGVHSYVFDADGPERLLQAVEAAVRTYRIVSQAHASDRLKMELLASVS